MAVLSTSSLLLRLEPLLCLTPLCSGDFTHGYDVTLEEIIKTLNTLSGKKTTCMELMVADVFAVPKKDLNIDPENTTEKEILCRATTVLRQIYRNHPVPTCLNKNGKLDILKFLRGLYRNLHSMAQLHNCPMSESKQRPLKDFLESLRSTMQKKYSECGRSMF